MDSCDRIIHNLGLNRWKDIVTDEIKTSGHLSDILDYTDKAYDIINDSIRNNNLSGKNLRLYNNIMSIYSNIPTTTQDIVVYRGVREYNNITEAKPGDILIEKGFISTSLDMDVALGFSSERKSIIIEILIPRNSKILILQDKYGTSVNSECELLIPANPVLRVINSKYDEYKRITILLVELLRIEEPTNDTYFNPLTSDKMYITY